jgi:DNA-binding MarR family transcriptional regulator
MNKNLLTKREEEILGVLAERGPLSPAKLVETLGVSKQRFFVIIKPLLEKGFITKAGKTPKVFYILTKRNDLIFDSLNRLSKALLAGLSQEEVLIIEDNFYQISPSGDEYFGCKAFVYWCLARKEQDVVKVAHNYIQTLKKYNNFKNSETGLIDASFKMSESFGKVYVKKLFYGDFYSIERYGKTKVGQMTFSAKRSENNILSLRVVVDIKKKVLDFIKKEKIDAVAYIPPTEYRKHQFMDTLRHVLEVPLPEIILEKVKKEILVPQKTLSKKEDREENAKATIFVANQTEHAYKKVLLLDDMVGSGATFNEVAKKILDKNIAVEVYAISVVGSFNGFEVVKEA